MTVKSRIQKLEAKAPWGDNVIVVDWGDGRLTVNGKEITREELDRLPKVTLIVVEYGYAGDKPDSVNECVK